VLVARDVEGYIATAGAKHPANTKRTPTGVLTRAMRAKLRRAGWRSRYRLRKQIVEPVFGQIKQARGFRQFLLRGMEKVRAEWAMHPRGYRKPSERSRYERQQVLRAARTRDPAAT
jgi:hypothetical protein